MEIEVVLATNNEKYYGILDVIDYAYKRSNKDKEAKNALMYSILELRLDSLNSDEWEYAKEQMNNPNYDPIIRMCKEGLYFHPRAEKCERCRRYMPECWFDKKRGKTTIVCNRCSDVLVSINWPGFDGKKPDNSEVEIKESVE